ncbi:hypothetical protein ACFU7T_11740 [Streptomyces sp. NPDC057555]
MSRHAAQDPAAELLSHLVEVTRLRPLPALAFPKKGRRGRVLLRGRRASS